MANNPTNNKGNPTNPNIPNIKPVKIDVDTKEAMSSLKELERQVTKLNSIAEQGSKQQNGFLSPKQVQLSRKILKEIDQSYREHYNKLIKMNEDYNNKKRVLDNKIKKDEENLNRARGANRWGNISSPGVINHYQNALNNSKGQLSSMQSQQSNMNSYMSVISKMSTQQALGNISARRINNLHQRRPSIRNMLFGAQNVLSATGAITSVGAGLNYINSGVDLRRQQEGNASIISQKYGDVGMDDAKLRNLTLDTGIKNQYGGLASLQTLGILGAGGMGSMSDMQKDLQSTQQFSKLYGVDADSTAYSGTVMKKLGALETGDMKQLANEIAGAISKTKMNGREAEMTQAITSLAQSVSQGLPSLSSGQSGNIIGLQTLVGQAIPALNGERGAATLSGIDQSMKSGGNSFDIVMGKGSKYQGISGAWELQKRKEQGISNPDNLRDYFNGLDRMSNSYEEKGFMAMQDLGISANTYEAFDKTGLITKLKQKGTLTQSDIDSLKEAGATDEINKIDVRNQQYSKKVEDLKSKQENDKADIAKPFNAGYTRVGEWFHNLPTGVQAGIGGAGIIGGSFSGTILNKMANGVMKQMPNIGGKFPTGGVVNKVANFGTKVAPNLGIATKILGPMSQLAMLSGDTNIEAAEKQRQEAKDFYSVVDKDKYAKSLSKVTKRGNKDLHYGNAFGLSTPNYRDEALEDMYPGFINSRKDVAKLNGKLSSNDIDLKTISGLMTSDDISKWKTIGSNPISKASYSEESWKSIEKSLSQVSSSDHNLKITINGSLPGLNEQNQNKVSDSIVNFFNSKLTSDGLDLSFDFNRR